MSMGYEGGDHPIGGNARCCSNCSTMGSFSEAQPTQHMFAQHHDAGFPPSTWNHQHHDAGFPPSAWNQSRTPLPTQSFMSHSDIPPGGSVHK
eukprot:7300562-Prorocentrum_lima.AAC.1